MNGSINTPAAGKTPAAAPVRKSAAAEAFFRATVILSGVIVLLLLGAIIIMLALGSAPTFEAFGIGFFASFVWNSVDEIYGAGIMIWGTLVTSLLALLLAVPLATGCAYFLTELLPATLRKPIGTVISLLAAVPSIIYGMWGFFVLAPLLSATWLWLADRFEAQPPVYEFLISASGTSIFTAGLVLAVMILPLITAMFVEILGATPVVLKESVYGLGATRWEVVREVAIPYGRRAMVGAIMLGLGRALGETMAVTFVIGNATRWSPSILSQGSTIASTIANEFAEAGFGTLKLSALLALGLTLFIISFGVLAGARALVAPRKY